MTKTRNLWEKQPPDLFWANLNATEKIVVNQGGTWSGKTYCIMQVLCTVAVFRKGYKISVISNTIPKLKEDSMQAMEDLINANPVLAEQIRFFNKSDRKYIFKNGSYIEFKSYENREQAKGGKRHIRYYNEATRIDSMVFFEAHLRTSVRAYIDYNPTAAFWVHDKVINNKEEYPSVKVIRSWHIHNPYLSQDQRDSIERIKDPELWKVYARGLTGKLQGTVFSFDVVPHPNPDDIYRVIWGLDLGYTNDPTVLVKVYQMKPGHQYDYIGHECCYITGLTPAAVSDIAKENGYKSGQVMYCEHDKEFNIQLRRLGIGAVNAEKGEVMNGVLYVKSLNIGITSDSKNGIQEMNMYRFIEIDGKPTNKPIDAHNHYMDAKRYAIFSHRNRRR